MLEILNTLSTNPISRQNKLRTILRFIRWQLASRILNCEFILPFIGSTSLVVKRGDHASTACFYSYLSEPEEMLFLAKYLRSSDLFIDIGSNVGTYTVLASGFARCTSISFEPSTKTVSSLQKNININSISSLVSIQQCALGSNKEQKYISTEFDTMNHLVSETDFNKKELVAVNTLDSFCSEIKNYPHAVLKIDVEGFEHNVLRGAKTILSLQSLNVVILESNHLSYKYGSSPQDIIYFLKSFGFLPYIFDFDSMSIINFNRGNKSFSDNLIFIKDFEYAYGRLNDPKLWSDYRDLF